MSNAINHTPRRPTRSKNPIWRRLKDFKCPFCNHDLNDHLMPSPREAGGGYQCPRCSFYIGKNRLSQLVSEMVASERAENRYKSRREQEEENQYGLNSF